MFLPGTEVNAGELTLTIREHKFPPFHCLIWKEEGKQFIHCLELDLLADATELPLTINNLIELIATQMQMAQEEHTQLFHPAPQEYWDKLFEIHRNRLMQAFLDSPPRTRADIMVSDNALTYA